MISKTLIDTVKAATGELGFVQPSEILASIELTTIQLKQLVIASCDELLDMHDWQSLITPYTITTNGSGSYQLPSDYLRMINQTAWNATTKQSLFGSVSSILWNTYVMNNDKYKFRVIADKINLANDTGGETITFLYFSNAYIIDGGGGANKKIFTLDSDKTIFHPRLLINFVKLKFMQIKGLNTAAVVEDFNSSLRQAISGDIPAATLLVDPPYDNSFEIQY